MTHIKPLALATVAAAALWMGATPEGRARDTGAHQGQQPPASDERESFRFRTGVELINVTATVTDQNGRFVSGLRKEDFRVYQDNEQQAVTHFNSERVPVSLGIALDTVPLELLSLQYARDENAQRLVISGLVQNPRSGAALSRVVATAFLFGPDGTFLTSSRAPLDFTTLAPGVESPFVVSVPVTGQVARYRVGFRTEDGQVIAHVDKRGPDALAQK